MSSAHSVRLPLQKATAKEEPMDRITPCLWSDTEAGEAAQFYTSVFPKSRIVRVSHYGSSGSRPEGVIDELERAADGVAAG